MSKICWVEIERGSVTVVQIRTGISPILINRVSPRKLQMHVNLVAEISTTGIGGGVSLDLTRISSRILWQNPCQI